jgi:hypothetical protein
MQINKIPVWAIEKGGEGYVTDLGVYEDITDLKIRIGTFDKDVLIEFEYKNEKEEK